MNRCNPIGALQFTIYNMEISFFLILKKYLVTFFNIYGNNFYNLNKKKKFHVYLKRIIIKMINILRIKIKK